MITTLKIWIVASIMSAFVVAQSSDCEKTCEPKFKAAIKCSTMDCYCYALDDPTVDSCLRSECGRGYDSIRRKNVDVCSAFGVTLDPNPPAGAIVGTTTSGSSPTGISSSGTGSGSGGGSSSTPGSIDKSGSQPTKERLTTAELIGIIIGSISAVTAIIGVLVTIKRRKDKTVSAPAPAYQQLLPSHTNVAFAPVQNIHVAPLIVPIEPPPRYQAAASPMYIPARPGNWKR